MTGKVLLLDIENAPNTAYVWGAWKNNIGQKQWVAKGYMMSVAWKWLGEDEIHYMENRTEDDSNLLAHVYQLLDEADVVVAHNGKKFDIPMILGYGVKAGLLPPSPFFVVDTFQTAKRELRIVSNSLANLCEEFGLPLKDDHKKFPGFELWVECMKGNEEAWEEMKEYNIHDVISLEALYLRLRPYMRNHPNIARPDVEGQVLCPKCGSYNINYRGYYTSTAGLVYRRFVCLDCGGWGKHRFMEKDKPKSAGRNAT